MSALHEQVKQLETRATKMRQALCDIAKLAAHHAPISETLRLEIQRIATEGATQ